MSKSSACHHLFADGSRAWLYFWPAPDPAKGVIQIVHGMAEHGGRYARFANALNALGWHVYAQDLPGHGRSVDNLQHLGHMADTFGWSLALAQIHGIREHLEQSHPDLPLVMLGHSMGSFLLQHHIVEHGNGLAGAIFSATSGSMGPLRAIGEQLMRAEKKVLGAAHRSFLAEQLTFKAFNKVFKPNRTASDWLSRDHKEVDAYIADPYCGFRCSAALWLDLLTAGATLMQGKRLARIPNSLPILLVSGDHDPVCQNGKGTLALENAYKKQGINSVMTKIYVKGRHELLNDTCRNLVIADISFWLTSQVPENLLRLLPEAHD